jgi:hypothetical protein
MANWFIELGCFWNFLKHMGEILDKKMRMQHIWANFRQSGWK